LSLVEVELSLIIAQFYRLGGRNRVFSENTGFEPLILVKNLVSLVFMRNCYLSKARA